MSAASRARVGRGAEGREGEGEGHDCGLARMPEHASRTAEDLTITPEYSQLPTLSLFCLLCMLDSVGCVLCVMCTRTVGLPTGADAGTGAYPLSAPCVAPLIRT